MPILNPNSTNYVHPWEPNLADLHVAMDYTADGEPALRVLSNIQGDITITGDVTIPGTVSVTSTPEDPVHTHVTEVGTSGILDVPYMPIGGTVTVNQPVAITDNNGSLTVDGTVSLSAETLSALETINATVSGSVSVSNFPATQPVSGTVTIQDGGGSITVDGSVSATVSGTVELGATTLAALENTTVTISGTPTVNVGTMPEVEIKNDSGNPIPVTGTINIQSTGNQGKLWTMQVAQGLVAGHSTVQTTGYNPATSAGDAVWAGGIAYPWASLTTAQTIYVKSSTNNANDRELPITIVGLDTNYATLTETVTLNASDPRTAVSTTNQFLRIHRMYVDDAADTNEGDISAHITSGSGTIVNKMLAGRGAGYTGTFTVPAGKTGYLFKGDASSTAATVVDFYVRYFGKAFMVSHVSIVDNSTYVYDFPFPPTLPEKTDMYCKISVGSGKTAINFEVLLVDNP